MVSRVRMDGNVKVEDESIWRIYGSAWDGAIIHGTKQRGASRNGVYGLDEVWSGGRGGRDTARESEHGRSGLASEDPAEVSPPQGQPLGMEKGLKSREGSWRDTCRWVYVGL